VRISASSLPWGQHGTSDDGLVVRGDANAEQVQWSREGEGGGGGGGGGRRGGGRRVTYMRFRGWRQILILMSSYDDNGAATRCNTHCVHRCVTQDLDELS